MTFIPPVEDYKFLIQDFINITKFSNLPSFEEVSDDLVDAILQEGAKFSSEVLAPINKIGDQQGCKRDTKGNVTTPDGFKEAYKKFIENGWTQISMPKEYGGQGLPSLLSTPLNEMFIAANMAFSMYPGLSRGAAEAILCHGSKEQKDFYLPKLTSGVWGGTMNLTEPQCGTDLGLIRSKAVKQQDGSFSITGQKIWISAGEHDFCENIIHLVLARIAGAPDGIKGISLFIVPKFLDDNGNIGERNKVVCGGLEHKMGINGNATCVMDYDGAKGFLLGEEHKGMRAMFVMMNAARLGVSHQGLGQAQLAYDNALAFAKDRLQSRSLTGAKYPELAADPIIVHPDVRRMLLDIKCFIEGARALVVWLSMWQDLAECSQDEKEKQKASDFLNLLTPVVKAYLTEHGFNACSQAMQIYGGSGYTEEWPASQALRDARIAMIYEGTNGIQALDLVGRKLMAQGGRYWQSFLKEIDDFLEQEKDNSDLGEYIKGLGNIRKDVENATMWLAQNAMSDPNEAGGVAYDYLQLFGLCSFTFMWAMMAKTALAKGGKFDNPFDIYGKKLQLGNYFLAKELPKRLYLMEKITSGAKVLMDYPDSLF